MARLCNGSELYRGVVDLDWTFVSPAASSIPANAPSATASAVTSCRGRERNSEVSAEDYAIAIADLIEQDTHARERVGVGW